MKKSSSETLSGTDIAFMAKLGFVLRIAGAIKALTAIDVKGKEGKGNAEILIVVGVIVVDDDRSPSPFDRQIDRSAPLS